MNTAKAKIVRFFLSFVFLLFVQSCVKTDGKVQQMVVEAKTAIAIGDNNSFHSFYGSPYTDAAYDIIEMSNGDFILAGQTSASGSIDCYILKLDQNGRVLNSFVLAADSIDIVNSLYETSDHGIILSGQTTSFENDGYDILVVKLNRQLELEWSNVLGGIGNDFANDIIQNYDEGYLLTGYSSKLDENSDDIFIIKLAKNGDLEWSKYYGGVKKDHASCIVQNNNGEIYVCGYSNSFGSNYDMFILKTDEQGDTIWTRTIGNRFVDRASKIILTDDGSCIIAGSSQYLSWNNMDMVVIKLSSEGEFVQGKLCGSVNNETVTSLCGLKSGGYIISGWTDGTSSGQSVFGFAQSANWKLLESKKLTTGLNEKSSACIQDSRGNIILAGQGIAQDGKGYKMSMWRLNPNQPLSCNNEDAELYYEDVHFKTKNTSTVISSGITVKPHVFTVKKVEKTERIEVCDSIYINAVNTKLKPELQ